MSGPKKWVVIIVCGMALVLSSFSFWPILQLNLLNVAATKALLANEPITPDMVRAMVHYTPVSSNRLTTAGLLWVKIFGESGREQAAKTLQLANSLGSLEERATLGVRLERQAEMWAGQGLTIQGKVAFELITYLALPFPEPYFRMGEAYYSRLYDIGIPCINAYELAIQAPASSPRDNDFKAMAHTRLCEHWLRGSSNYILAEYHCRQAIQLGTYRVFSGEYIYLAYILLGQTLAEQERFTEAIDVIQSILQQRISDKTYEAMGMYTLAYYVLEAQSSWSEALEIYRQIILLQAAESWTEAARNRMMVLCVEHPEIGCSTP